MDSRKWYRVIDPLNPLFGCDVDGYTEDKAFGNGRDGLVVTAMRRVDIVMGDRPFQLVAKDDEDLGIMVDWAALEESRLQDETVELTTERPFGRCIDESEMTRRDGLTLRIARYESAVQIAIEDADDGLLATRTLSDSEKRVESLIVNLWSDGTEADDLVTALKLAGGN